MSLRIADDQDEVAKVFNPLYGTAPAVEACLLKTREIISQVGTNRPIGEQEVSQILSRISAMSVMVDADLRRKMAPREPSLSSDEDISLWLRQKLHDLESVFTEWLQKNDPEYSRYMLCGNKAQHKKPSLGQAHSIDGLSLTKKKAVAVGWLIACLGFIINGLSDSRSRVPSLSSFTVICLAWALVVWLWNGQWLVNKSHRLWQLVCLLWRACFNSAASKLVGTLLFAIGGLMFFGNMILFRDSTPDSLMIFLPLAMMGLGWLISPSLRGTIS
jgi:hypothetical protein